MERLPHRTLRPRYSPTGERIQNGRTEDEIPRGPITPWCGPPLFCPCFSLAETSVLKISLFSFTKYSSCLLYFTLTNADTDSSANDRLIINSIHLALEAVSLQWIEDEKEFPMRTHRFLATVATCMELLGLPVARHSVFEWRQPTT